MLTDEQRNELMQIEHIGDGVYVQFTGYSIDIRVNDHRGPVTVTLEPDVLASLNTFYRKKNEQLARFIG